jgi:Xaa-Pro dipeptidase
VTLEFPDLAELKPRWTRIQNLMAEQSIDGALFLQNVDLIYVSGTEQTGAMFLPVDGDPTIWGPAPVDRLAAMLPWADIHPMPSWSRLGDELKKIAPGLKVLGLEMDVLPVSMYQRLSAKSLAGFDLVDVSTAIRRARAIKSDYEIRCIQTAANIMADIYSTVPDVIKPGMTELELDAYVTGQARSRGHQGIIRGRAFNMEMYFGHLLSGPSGLVPAKLDSPTGGTGVGSGFGQGASFRKIEKGDLVSIDLCGTWGGYISDQTRLFFVGRAPNEIKDKCDAVAQLLGDLCGFMEPGVACVEVYNESLRLADQYGLGDGFMGRGEFRTPYVGHGVGLELDEYPALARGVDVPLEAGMALAVEPCYFMPEVGAVGIEDTFVMTSDGPKKITPMGRELVEVPV